MAHFNIGWNDKKGEIFKKIDDFLENNLKKIDEQKDIEELKKISIDLAKRLQGFQIDYYQLINLISKSKRVEFSNEHSIKRGKFVTASKYISEYGWTQRKALLKALEFPTPRDKEEEELIEKWRKSFKAKESDNELNVLPDSEIQFIIDYKKFLKENPQYRKPKKKS